MKKQNSTPTSRRTIVALTILVAVLMVLPFLAFAGAANGQTAPFPASTAEVPTIVADSDTLKTDCSITMWSAYVLTIGVRGSNDDELAVQASCATSHTSGFYAGWWASQSSRNPGLDGTFANEVDWFGGWAGEMRGISLSGIVQYYDLANPGIFDGRGGDLWDFGITAVVPLTSVWRLTADSHYLVETDADAPQAIPGGWYAQVGVGRDWQTAVPMSADIFLVHNEGVGGFDTELIRVVSSIGGWEKEGLIFSVPLRLSLPLRGNAVDDEWAVGVAVGF